MSEINDLLTKLRATRAALVKPTTGLTDEQAGATPTASELTLGGLIKHSTTIEHQWLRFVVEGPSAMSYELPDGVTWADIAAGTARELPAWMTEHQNDFKMLPGETLAGVLARYEEEAAETEKILLDADLDVVHPLPAAPWFEPGAEISVRRVILHVITETAQHAGHADIIRESLDGQKSS